MRHSAAARLLQRARLLPVLSDAVVSEAMGAIRCLPCPARRRSPGEPPEVLARASRAVASGRIACPMVCGRAVPVPWRARCRWYRAWGEAGAPGGEHPRAPGQRVGAGQRAWPHWRRVRGAGPSRRRCRRGRQPLPRHPSRTRRGCVGASRAAVCSRPERPSKRSLGSGASDASRKPAAAHRSAGRRHALRVVSSVADVS